MLNINVIPKKGRKTASRVMDGEAIVFQTEKGVVRVFNKVATAIWEMIDGKHSVDEIIETVCEKYEVDRAVAKNDILAFFETMSKLELIENDK